MDNLYNSDLFRTIIVDHATNPRNFGHLPHCTCQLEGINPSCGDSLELEVQVEDNKVKDVSFTGEGCSIFKASSSILTEMVKDKTVDEAEKLARAFKAYILSEDLTPYKDMDMGELEALFGVSQLPARVKCALLSWNTLLGALGKETLSDED